MTSRSDYSPMNPLSPGWESAIIAAIMNTRATSAAIRQFLGQLPSSTFLWLKDIFQMKTSRMQTVLMSTKPTSAARSTMARMPLSMPTRPSQTWRSRRRR